MDRNRLIGNADGLPWRLPGDLKWFKSVTMDKPVIMGRKTHESIGRPLPGRRNIVITRDPVYTAAGCECVTDIDAALERAGEAPEAMVIGGAQIYRAVLPRAGRMYLTLIDAAFEGDTWFPDFDPAEWRERERETHRQPGEAALTYHFVVLERIDGV
jgi:dihydrofolate reductase